MISDARIEQIVRLILRKGWNLAKVSQALGISKASVVRYLNLGKKRGIEVAEEARALTRKRPRNEGEPVASYKLQDGFVRFEGLQSVTSGTWELPKSIVEELFFAYSNDGEGAQVNQICRRYNLPRALFLEIKEALGLTHTSPPYPPWKFEEATPDELAELTLERRQRAWELKLLERQQEWAERKLKEVLDRKVLEDRLVEAVIERLEPLPPPEIKRPRAKPQPQAVALHLADVHLGQQGKRENVLANEYSIEVILRWMEDLKRQFYLALAQHRGSVEHGYLIDHGDFFDSIIARIFEGQEYLQDVRGEEAFLLGLKVKRDLIAFMADLLPKLYVVILDGNHDGPRSSRVWMPRFNTMAGKILEYEFSRYKHVKFIIPGMDVAALRYGRSLLVALHGTGFKGSVAAKRAKFYSLLDGIDTTGVEWVYCMAGHYHSEWLKEIGGHKVIIVPAFAPSNDYGAEVYWDRHRPAQLVSWFEREQGLVGLTWLYLGENTGSKVAPTVT